MFIHNTIHIKKFHLIEKHPQCSYLMINKGLKKFAKIEWSEPSHLNSSFLIGTWILNIFWKRSTYRKKSPKTVPDYNIKRKSFKMDWNNIFGQCSLDLCLFLNAFRILFLHSITQNFMFFFLYNVLTTSWIVFFLHHRICLSKANKGSLERIYQESDTSHSGHVVENLFGCQSLQFQQILNTKIWKFIEGLVNHHVKEPRSR